MPSSLAVCVGRRPLATLWVLGWMVWIVLPPGLLHARDATTTAPSPVVSPVVSTQHWAFQPVRRPSLPSTIRERWVQSPIDAYILASLQQHNLAPAAAADRRTLLRRATYDLLGLPPTPEELDRFLSDASPDAFSRVVDRLLSSPAYGERWGRHWLDVVRYADARDLIQLPIESDFREAWRYRDWVIQAHNRDLPFPEFVRCQIAGDLLQPADPEKIDADALVATGLLAIADFVPGDVDKERMIADYVNDQIDVVGRAFLGLTLGCARCHDHKFDPISIEDYYSLAGMFFSSRLIPSPVPGNTPLMKVPLLPKAELDRIAVKKQRVTAIEKSLPGLRSEADIEYFERVQRLTAEETARYLVASWEYSSKPPGNLQFSPGDYARASHLHPLIFTRWLDYLGLRKDRTVEPGFEPGRTNRVWLSWKELSLSNSTGSQARTQVETIAHDLQEKLAANLQSRSSNLFLAGSGITNHLRAELLRFRAGEARSFNPTNSRVSFWPNRFPSSVAFAGVAADALGPWRTNVTVSGRIRPVLHFGGDELLEARLAVPARGSLFAVFRVADPAASGQRLVGWEDSDGGKHGLGLMPTSGGGVHAILRNEGMNGDIVAPPSTNAGLRVISLIWGQKGGSALYCDGIAAGRSATVDGLSTDPTIKALRIGGPGSGNAAKFRGDLAELRIYSQPLEDRDRVEVEKELFDLWLNPSGPEATPPSDLALAFDELCSPRGPFWLESSQRGSLLDSGIVRRIQLLEEELSAVRLSIPAHLPQAVVVQEGGPAQTKHEGFKDAQVYLRGNPSTPGKVVPRGVPRIFVGEKQPPIGKGSGRLNFADWIASTNNPLTARVAVNRIWQHHFGDGIVRTSSNFGGRGELPSHPELLDYLAWRLVESGWSMKAMHRLMMLSSVYQQTSKTSPNALRADPENRLWGRMNRTRLDSESIRDSLLVVGGRLDSSLGGVGFQEIGLPRRSVYLMSVRTGAKSGFASVFDAPDCGSVVEKRSVSTVAPQALFLMNDPFAIEQARELARRVRRERSLPGGDGWVRSAYRLALGRYPSAEELSIGLELIRGEDPAERLERYCQLLICSNEFVYLD